MTDRLHRDRKDFQPRRFFHWRYVGKERRSGYRRGALLLLLSIPFFLFCDRHVIGAGRVTDVSMLPTLREGGYFLINKYAYRLHPPERGDIVVLLDPERRGWRYVKRVVGLSGEQIAIRDNRVYVNGAPLEEPYAAGATYPPMPPRVIPTGHLFVLGDNREDSQDSRQFGPVPLERVEGKIKPGTLFPLR